MKSFSNVGMDFFIEKVCFIQLWHTDYKEDFNSLPADLEELGISYRDYGEMVEIFVLDLTDKHFEMLDKLGIIDEYVRDMIVQEGVTFIHIADYFD